MRKISLLIIFVLSLFLSENVIAQSDVSITKIAQNGQRIELTISSAKPFYVGGNSHILHIGKKDFTLNKQKNTDGTGSITFYISLDEFNSLIEGDYIWMSYGNKFKKAPDPKTDPATFCKKNSKTCWALGKLSKQIGEN